MDASASLRSSALRAPPLGLGRDGAAHRRAEAAIGRLVRDGRLGRPPRRDRGALGPGEVGDELRIPPAMAERAIRIAFVAGQERDDAASRVKDVVWSDGENELLVRAGRVRARFADGLVLVGIPVFCEQTGETEVVVAFAVGSPDAPAGLVMVTETVPRGPAAVVDRWGDALVAAAWDAVLEVAVGVAAAAGDDAAGAPLLPAALAVNADGVAVLPQARFEPPA